MKEGSFTMHEIPKLNDWVPEEEDIVFEIVPNTNKIRAALYKCKSLEDAPDELKEKLMLLSTFSIKWKHYMQRMEDITKVINYFIKFYDDDDEYMMALMSLKYHVDSDRCRDVQAFQTMLLHTLVTDTMTEKINKMICDLEPANIETDKSTSYKSTPKLTNEDAHNILLLSYYFRFILPITIHWFNLPSTVGIENGKNYIQTFVCIFKCVVEKIGEGTINVYILIKQLINHRIEKKFNSDAIIHEKKKEFFDSDAKTEKFSQSMAIEINSETSPNNTTQTNTPSRTIEAQNQQANLKDINKYLVVQTTLSKNNEYSDTTYNEEEIDQNSNALYLTNKINASQEE